MRTRLRRRLPKLRFGTGRSRPRGQSLVEFALVIPIFLVLLMAVIEFGFLLNGLLSINFATRDAALVAAESGNVGGDGTSGVNGLYGYDRADCIILQKIVQDVTAPANSANVSQVQIYWTNAYGQPLATDGSVTTAGSAGQAVDTYVPGSMTCALSSTVTVTVPFRPSSTAPQYLSSTRCNEVGGSTQTTGLNPCPSGHPGLDTIAVQVTYSNTWVTPLHNLLGLLGNGWTLTQSNEMRMEPVL